MPSAKGSSEAPLPEEIELAAMSAWPARETLFVDGFVLRLDAGYTRRVNSATALLPFRRAEAEGIERCEAAFEKAGLQANFRMLSSPAHPAAAAALVERGYVGTDRTLVQWRAIDRAPGPAAGPSGLSILRADDRAWMRAFGSISGQAAGDQAHHAAILRRIRPERLPLLALVDEQAVGAALAVIDGPWIGLFDFVVAPAWRRRGIAAALLDEALARGHRRGGRRAYLQVVEANRPARALYAGRGFETRYAYHYRAGPPSGSRAEDEGA